MRPVRWGWERRSFFLHWVIGLAERESKFGVVVDQSLRLLCKLAYVLVLSYSTGNVM